MAKCCRIVCIIRTKNFLINFTNFTSKKIFRTAFCAVKFVTFFETTSFYIFCTLTGDNDHYAFWGSLEPRTAIEGSFSAWGGLGKLDHGLGRGEPFFPDSDSDSDSDETFQISQKLGRVYVDLFVEFFCDSQPCKRRTTNVKYTISVLVLASDYRQQVFHLFI
jgi:hypothetical protein